jgi:hypothetical protein
LSNLNRHNRLRSFDPPISTWPEAGSLFKALIWITFQALTILYRNSKTQNAIGEKNGRED